ncbi:hypothetical protein [Brachyspira murdochii]|uniref:Uncharacterized protein n=1 Tax=Brachyspira murdochii (strain ATCC 51284 / DSM 12563 / 56-150) TaxID=526224 RepID=D5UAE6_BRAM5|nr:hypothetical protein [Brachyspira murdochii]ADG71669.1 conserved hypothetical protein [Brachyspira murdochii DSM 12563]
MSLIILIIFSLAALLIVLFMFEDFLDLVTDIILMLLTCIFVFFYSVCFLIVDIFYVFIADYLLAFVNFIFIRPFIYFYKRLFLRQ